MPVSTASVNNDAPRPQQWDFLTGLNLISMLPPDWNYRLYPCLIPARWRETPLAAVLTAARTSAFSLSSVWIVVKPLRRQVQRIPGLYIVCTPFV